jgi:hypothetical protein
MGESIKAILSLIVLIAIFGSWYAWTIGRKDFPRDIGTIRLTLAAVGITSLSLLIWAVYRRDKLPDHLRAITRRRFDCGGLAFAPVTDVRDGTLFLDIYFQNSFQRPCVTRLLIRPAVQNLGVRRPADVPPIELTIECDGGAFGVASVPFPVPHLRLGQKLRFNVGGVTRFPDGRGKRLRFREGVTVRPPTGLADALVTGASLLTGHLHYRKDAAFVIRLPLDVRRDSSPDPTATCQILWRPQPALDSD